VQTQNRKHACCEVKRKKKDLGTEAKKLQRRWKRDGWSGVRLFQIFSTCSVFTSASLVFLSSTLKHPELQVSLVFSSIYCVFFLLCLSCVFLVFLFTVFFCSFLSGFLLLLSLSLLLCSAFLFLKAGTEMDQDDRCWSFCAQPMVAASGDRETDRPRRFWSLFVFSPSADAFSRDDEDDGDEGVLCLWSCRPCLCVFPCFRQCPSYGFLCLPCLSLVSSCLSFLVFLCSLLSFSVFLFSSFRSAAEASI